MTEATNELFVRNIGLLKLADKAVYFFRIQENEKALEHLSELTEDLKPVLALSEINKDMLPGISPDELTDMLSKILEAARKEDYVLIADLIEIEFIPLICAVQKKLMSEKDFDTFSVEGFKKQCIQMAAKLKNDQSEEAAARLFKAALSPDELLEKGYRAEFSACGLMTVAAGNGDNAVYIHTNGRIVREAELLAGSWVKDNKDTYIVNGFGFGYHVEALTEMVPEAEIVVYESNDTMLKLACAFAPLSWLFTSAKVKLIYDYDKKHLAKRLEKLAANEQYVVHKPSQRANQ